MVPTIEVSTELYRALQSVGVVFEDKSPEDVIWRLIKDRQAREIKPLAASQVLAVGGLMAKGVLIPNGLKLRFKYKGHVVPAEVRDGRILVGDVAFGSPSSAAEAAAAALGWSRRSLNGWWYMEYEDKGTWKRLDSLRKTRETRRRKRA
jgi:hypothetical protein